MGSWQDRNGSLAGQKWELGRTEMRAWQMIICKTPHFASFPVIFVCFLPLLDGFCNILMFFFHFCLFFSHSPAIFAYWQNSLAEKLSTVTWQDRIEELGPPLTGKNVGRKGLNFGRTEWLAPPSENGPAMPMAISNISVPGLHDDVMGSAGEEGSHGHHTVYT